MVADASYYLCTGDTLASMEILGNAFETDCVTAKKCLDYIESGEDLKKIFLNEAN